MAVKTKLTVEDLIRLDNYGHKELSELTSIQLNEYATLTQMRYDEILDRISKLAKETKTT